LGVEGQPYPNAEGRRQARSVVWFGNCGRPRWYLVGYHLIMQPASILRACRQQRGLTLRDLSRRAGTSHSTLAAYESGRKVPGADTLLRVVRAAGFDLIVGPYAFEVSSDPRNRGEELEEVLALADMLPSRHARTLDAPIFERG